MAAAMAMEEEVGEEMEVGGWKRVEMKEMSGGRQIVA